MRTDAAPACAEWRTRRGWCGLQVVARWKRARASILTLPHCRAKTPMFMPVGTQGERPAASAPETLVPPTLVC